MGPLDWFGKRRKKKIDEEKQVLEHTGKLQTQTEKRVKKEPKKRKRKKERA